MLWFRGMGGSCTAPVLGFCRRRACGGQSLQVTAGILGSRLKLLGMGPLTFDASAVLWRATARLPLFLTGRTVASEFGAAKAPCMKASTGSNGSVPVGISKPLAYCKVLHRRTLFWLVWLLWMLWMFEGHCVSCRGRGWR